MSAWRNLRTTDDGSSRPFGGGTARDVVAETLARRNGWAEIRPAFWADAGAVLRDLRAAGFTVRRSSAGAAVRDGAP